MNLSLYGLLLAVTGIATVWDIRRGIVPDALTIPALAIIATAAFLQRHEMACVLGIALAAGLLSLLFAVTFGRGLGLGDVKLGACIGAALGPEQGLHALGIAFVAGGFLGSVLLLLGRATRTSPIPFAPFLAIGAAVAPLGGAG
jgi:leader peptidase (prepilin peptidase)/N-methyltransferase